MIEKVREFYDNYAGKLSIENCRHRHVFHSLDTLLPQDRTVLDIGCGTGITSRHLAERNTHVLAIDLSPVLIEQAKKINPHERIDYVCGNICEMDCDEKFDSIVMVDVLEHLLKEATQGLFRVLAKASHDGTRIYLNIPAASVIRFVTRHRPELLQIVDNPIEITDILAWFEDIGFVPAYFQFYWHQYVEFLFVTRQEFDKTMAKIFT